MLSWNRYPASTARRVHDLTSRAGALPRLQSASDSLLPRGNGRSYGDVCLNEGGTLLRTRSLDRFITFDRLSGRLACESGVLLKDILDLVVPQGWFLPVTPGTRQVSIGGAIANDVHGKNHHVAGSFGHHVIGFELLRSDGERKLCYAGDEWFRASVGGMGLTGVITWAEIQLMPIANPFMLSETQRFANIESFWALNNDAEARWPYTVAWIDCLAGGATRGRGLLMTGQHAPANWPLPLWHERGWRFPFDPPFSLVNNLSLRLFNTGYFHRPLHKGTRMIHHVPYFYPLDSIQDWNRLYGRRGFFQYQCVLPPASARAGISELLQRISASGMGSFLAVLKTFGPLPAAGLLSFPRAGATLALDFPNRGERSARLFNELDTVVREAGGALYPAKDARMSGSMFRLSFPEWERFCAYIDPCFSSGFWRRVSE